jgi:hypothetical protein
LLEDSLLYSPDPIKFAREFRKQLREDARQGIQQTETSTSSLLSQLATQGGNGNGNRELGDAEVPPRRRTLGDFTQYQGPRHHANIVMPPSARAIEINPTLLNYLIAHLFTEKDHEDPYNHLDDFYALIGTLGLQKEKKKLLA